MAQPTIIIEIRGGNLEVLYSNTDVSFFLINRDNADAGGPLITGPFEPTLVKEDLGKVFPDDPEISPELLTQPPLTPYF